MLDLKKYDVNSNVEGFYFIKEEGYYSGRLCAVRISKQDKQFVEEGKQPRDQISFVFDIINEDGNHVHVQTKPSSITFGERSNIPKLWAKVKELKNGSDLSNFLYKEGGLGKVFKVNVEVTEKDDQVFNTVTKVSGESAMEIEPSKLTSWDLKVFGKDCEEYDLAEGYEVATGKTKGTSEKPDINDFV